MIHGAKVESEMEISAASAYVSEMHNVCNRKREGYSYTYFADDSIDRAEPKNRDIDLNGPVFAGSVIASRLTWSNRCTNENNVGDEGNGK